MFSIKVCVCFVNLKIEKKNCEIRLCAAFPKPKSTKIRKNVKILLQISESCATIFEQFADAFGKCSISGCGAAGSALDWGSRGREFKSRHSDQIE